jgi:hypothetical protein
MRVLLASLALYVTVCIPKLMKSFKGGLITYVPPDSVIKVIEAVSVNELAEQLHETILTGNG